MDKEKEQAKAKANTNTGILHSVQDDDIFTVFTSAVFFTLQHLRGLPWYGRAVPGKRRPLRE
jgi:hypothetical protein